MQRLLYRELDWLSIRVGSQDTVYIFFAGHGQPDRTDRVYLMPYDADPAAPNVLGIRSDTFLEDVAARISPSNLLMFIDACHSASIYSPGGTVRADDENVVRDVRSKWTEVFGKQKGARLAFLSAASRQKSWEDRKLRHGLFTWYLVEGMRGRADTSPANGLVTAGEVRRYVVDMVEARSTLQFEQPQTPTVSPDFDPGFVMAVRRPALMAATSSTTGAGGYWTYVQTTADTLSKLTFSVASTATIAGMEIVFDGQRAGIAYADSSLDITRFLTTPGAAAARPVRVQRVAYVDAQRLANTTTLGKSATSQLNQLKDSKQKEIDALVAKKATASGQEGSRLQAQLDQLQQKAQEDLDALNARLLTQFSNAIQPHLSRVAAALKLQVVFTAGDSGIVWADPAMDVTQPVLRSMEPTTPAPPPAAIPSFGCVGSVDLQRLAKESRLGRESQVQVTALHEARLKELRSLEAQEARATGPAKNQLAARVEQFRTDAQSEVDAVQKKLQDGFAAAVNPVVDRLMREQDCLMLFARDQAGLLYVSESLDMTSELLDRMGR